MVAHLLARLHLTRLVLVVLPEVDKPIPFELLYDNAPFARELYDGRVSDLCSTDGRVDVDGAGHVRCSIRRKRTYIPEGVALIVDFCSILRTRSLLGLLGHLCWPLITAGVVAHDKAGAALAHFAGGATMR